MSVEFNDFEREFDPLAELNLLNDSLTQSLEEERHFNALVRQGVRTLVWNAVAQYDIWPRFSKKYQANAHQRWINDDARCYPAISTYPAQVHDAPYKNRIHHATRLVGSALTYYLLSPDEASPDVHHQKIRAEHGIKVTNLYDRHYAHFAEMIEEYIPSHPSIDDTPQEVVREALQTSPDANVQPQPWQPFNPVSILLDVREAGISHPVTTETITDIIWADRYIGKAALSSCPPAISLQAGHLCKRRDEQLAEAGLVMESEEFMTIVHTINSHLYPPTNNEL